MEFTCSESSSSASLAALVSILPFPFEGEALITSIATTYTTEAFPLLTPFQTIFVGLFLLQILIYQLLGIVPFNLNDVLHGDHGSGFKKGRRRRDASLSRCDEKQGEIFDKIFDVLKRIDKYDCILRALCETQAQSIFGHRIPVGLNQTFEGLKMMNEKVPMELDSQIPKLRHIQVFMEAAGTGLVVGSSQNSSLDCFSHYNSCPITTGEILEYIDAMRLDDFI